MKRHWKRAVALLAFLHCCLWLPLIQGEPPEAASNNTQPVNLAVFIDGQVTVRRQGWTRSVPVVFGTSLRSGDLLSLDQSSHAKVVCSDLTLHDIASGSSGVPCSTSNPLLRWSDGSMINVTRGGWADGSSPIVLSPRKTKLLSPNPLLRWTPVSGATAYTVMVREVNLAWQLSVASVTQIAYPDSAPRLKADVDYKLIVQARGRSSDEEQGLGLGFAILSSKDKKEVEREQRRIEDLGLPEGPTQFLVAYLYARHDLNAEAIQRLESASQNFKVAAVARLLGDLYLKIGLTRQAEASYLNSLNLSEGVRDEEGQMLAHLALARIYERALGNKDTASQHLKAELALAEKIGDDSAASQARGQLAELDRAMVP